MAIAEGVDTVTVHYVVFHPDDSVLMQGQMEVPRSDIHLDENADGGIGTVMRDGLEWTIVHYGDPARSGGEEWYEVERTTGDTVFEDSEDNTSDDDGSDSDDDGVTVFRFIICNSDGTIFSITDEELPSWCLTENEDPTRMVWDGLEYTLEETCWTPGEEWFILEHTLPEAETAAAAAGPAPDAGADDAGADDAVLPLSATLVTYDADGHRASTAMVTLPMTAIVPNASGLGTITHDGAEYTVVERLDEPGSQWCEAHRVLSAPEEDGELTTIDLTTHYDDGWVDEQRVRVPGTAVYFRAGDLRIEHWGIEYTFQNIYEACEGGVYTAWRHGGAVHPDAANLGLTPIPEEATIE